MLNLIEAPCGSGKTYFVEHKLVNERVWGNMLYITDSKNGLEAFKKRGEKIVQNGETIYKHEGITSMNYAGFATLCKHNTDKNLWNDEYSLIVCDELQSAIKWSSIRKNGEENTHQRALEELHIRIANGAKIVAISATPNIIREEFADEYIDVPVNGTLTSYKTGEKQSFAHPLNVIPQLPKGKKGIIYLPHITLMNQARNFLSAKGFRCACVWSINNLDNDMTEDDKRARNCIIEEEIIPEDIDILIINAASETGLNIRSHIDYILIDSIDEDTITQVRGRARSDVALVYIREKKFSDISYISAIDKKWLDIPLYTEDKEALCTELKLKDSRGRVMGWTTIKKGLEQKGYTINNTHTRNGDYSVITH